MDNSGNWNFKKDVDVVGDVSCVDLTATGDLSCVDLTATGDVSCVDLTATGDVSCVDLTATGDLSLSGAITTDLDVGKSGSGNAKNLEVFGTTRLRGNTNVGATGAGNSANLKVWGNLEYTGTLSGSVPVPNNIGNPCFSSFEMRFVSVYDADINVPHFLGCYCDQLLSGGNIEITMKNLGISGVGKSFYLFRTSGTTNPIEIINDSGQDIYLHRWDTGLNREVFAILSNTSSAVVINLLSANLNFTWWKFVYMEVNYQYRWIGKQLASCWEI
jgi:hypothetical protein